MSLWLAYSGASPAWSTDLFMREIRPSSRSPPELLDASTLLVDESFTDSEASAAGSANTSIAGACVDVSPAPSVPLPKRARRG